MNKRSEQYTASDAAFNLLCETQATSNFFFGFSQLESEALSAHLTIWQVCAGDVVVEVSESPTWFGVLCVGSLAVVKDSLQVGSIQRGEILGDVTLFTEGAPSVRIVCETPATLLTISHSTLEELQMCNSLLCFKLYQICGRAASIKLQRKLVGQLGEERFLRDPSECLKKSLLGLLKSVENTTGCFGPGFSYMDFEIMAEYFSLHLFNPRAHVIKRGQLARHLIVVLQGSVEARASNHPNSRRLGYKLCGDFLGEEALLQSFSRDSVSYTRSCDVYVKSPCLLAILPFEALPKMNECHPDVVWKLMRRVATRVLERFLSIQRTQVPDECGAWAPCLWEAQHHAQEAPPAHDPNFLLQYQGLELGSARFFGSKRERRRTLESPKGKPLRAEILAQKSKQKAAEAKPERNVHAIVGQMTAEKVWSLLQQAACYSRFLRGLTHEELEELMKLMTAVKMKKTEKLIQHGQPATFLVLVLSGHLCIKPPASTKPAAEAEPGSPDKDDLLMLGQGDLVGYMNLFLGGSRVTDVVAGRYGAAVALIQYDQLVALNRSKPHLALKVLHMLGFTCMNNIKSALTGHLEPIRFELDAHMSIAQRFSILMEASGGAILGRRMSEDEMLKFATSVSIHELMQGEAVFRKGQPCGVLLLVLDGELEAHVDDQATPVISHAGPGRAIGETAMLSLKPGSNQMFRRHNVYVKSETAVTAVVLQSTLEHLNTVAPKLARELFVRIMQHHIQSLVKEATFSASSSPSNEAASAASPSGPKTERVYRSKSSIAAGGSPQGYVDRVVTPAAHSFRMHGERDLGDLAQAAVPQSSCLSPPPRLPWSRADATTRTTDPPFRAFSAAEESGGRIVEISERDGMEQMLPCIHSEPNLRGMFPGTRLVNSALPGGAGAVGWQSPTWRAKPRKLSSHFTHQMRKARDIYNGAVTKSSHRGLSSPEHDLLPGAT
ncbi:hypothetical protein CYMTET_42997 [Cymbomonas tetramitiformis]|uniref:Cyclic nucleotide-binding domain-containing protein n=1 Tax=Cymbomonas tetramitiformis TaxID=36881 RepID=A0AAE0F131_9CHLO|nr:hypothetical protein CYMTET_42997 [Cymbomonas tetramitiformis]